ncbi:MAG TPA: hypothetical protein VER12_07930 [Polyangiaceae bacterium]|nr:hypothetical protein [Polyangiaceae bacterium]
MPTSNLNVYSASYNPGTGIMTCLVTAAAPLYIYGLLIEATANLGAPTGLVRPGSAQNPVLRTIFADSHDPVFTATAPFTLAVTYDATYHVSALQVVQGFARASHVLNSDAFADSNAEPLPSS